MGLNITRLLPELSNPVPMQNAGADIARHGLLDSFISAFNTRDKDTLALWMNTYAAQLDMPTRVWLSNQLQTLQHNTSNVFGHMMSSKRAGELAGAAMIAGISVMTAGAGSAIGAAVGNATGSSIAATVSRMVSSSALKQLATAQLSTGNSGGNVDFKDFLRGAASTLITGTSSDANGLIIPDFGTIVGGGIEGMRNAAATGGLPPNVVAGTAPVMTAGAGGSILQRLIGGGGVLAGAVGVVRSVGGRILKFILPSGAVVSRSAAVKLAKEVGLTAAAAALGTAVTDLAEAVMQEHKHKKHRGRGITAAQLRTTGRTMRKIERMHRFISHLARGAVHHRR